MAIKTYTLKETDKLTEEQIKEIKEAAKTPIVFDEDCPELTDEEADVNRRGRNAKSNTHAKNASVMDYRKATSLEALLGYLYLKGEDERILKLVKTGLKKGNFIWEMMIP